MPGVHNAVIVSDEVADAIEQAQPVPGSSAQEYRELDPAIIPVQLCCVVEPLEDVAFPGD